MPEWFFKIYGWCVFACMVVEATEPRFCAGAAHRRDGAALISVVMIFGALYSSWNAVGSRDNIEGRAAAIFYRLRLCHFSFRRCGG